MSIKTKDFQSTFTSRRFLNIFNFFIIKIKVFEMEKTKILSDETEKVRETVMRL